MSAGTAGSDSVIVAVLTYRRPDDLAAIVPVLIEQAASVPLEVRVLVVDNDPEGSAKEYVTALTGPVHYVHEPTPGIAAARNRAIDEAATDDVLVFIDDDELPVPGWLEHLLQTRARTGADAVIGPVESVFSGELDPWIAAGGFFTRRRLATGTPVTVAATNNMLLDLATVRAQGLRFDPGLGLIGGEDALFTRQLSSNGGRMVWCAEAMVHDMVPAGRMTRSWVLKRAFRMGGSASRAELLVATTLRQRLTTQVRQLLLGLSRLGAGLVRLSAGTLGRSQALRAAGARNCARGLGLIAGVFGFVYAEYRR
jgi:cellulose synthase/poly-beta-1,6-N-acetylglucosamine synthase-like glycosyltransferase